MQAALERKLLIVPVTTIKDVAESEQFAERDYWRHIDHGKEYGVVSYPGPFVRFSHHPIRYQRRAPLIGEHNSEILSGELKIEEKDYLDLQSKAIIP